MSRIQMLSRILPLDPDQGPRRTVLAMVGVIALFLLTALIWALVAQLDVAVQARGAVEAPSKLQEVQSLEGGIVEQMLVQPGQRVRAGEPVVRLDTAQYEAGVGESRPQRLAAMAGLARTEALLAGREPRFDPAWRSQAPELISKETQHWQDALREYQGAVAAAAETAHQRSAELDEAKARLAGVRQELSVAQESLRIEDGLYKQGAGARADYLAAQQRMLNLQTQAVGLEQSLPRLSAALAVARAEQTQAGARYRSQWGQQRVEFETQASRLAETLKAQDDKLARRELLAPVDGVVNRVLVPTKGGVALPGKPIVEIVPDEARLQLSARVAPADIGFLHPGQLAYVRVLAYDSATFGQMQARLERIGADALVDEKGNTYFEIQLSAERGQLKLHGQPLPLSPGMPADISVLTGQRSVMQYLLKPVLRGVQGALQER